MIGEKFKARLKSIFKEWFDDDRFGATIIDPTGTISNLAVMSVREFITAVFYFQKDAQEKRAAENIKAVIHPIDIDMKFDDFLTMTFLETENYKLSVKQIAYDLLCIQPQKKLIREVFMHRSFVKGDVETQVSLHAESGFNKHDQYLEYLSKPEQSKIIADILFDQLKTQLGKKTLRSFYIQLVNETGYRAWWPGARTDIGRPLKQHIIDCNIYGKLTLNVSRYTEIEDLTVKPYEWAAELRSETKSELPDAIAYGMVYVLEREDGFPIGDKQEVLIAADSVADTDVLQVNSFFEQYEDAENIIEDSDLCFVWLWERRDTAKKGAGKACLSAALKDLKKRFPRLDTLVIDLKPYQFKGWGELDPPSIEVAKVAVFEKLKAFIKEAGVENMFSNYRPILNVHESDPNQAMLALGKASLEGMSDKDRKKFLDDFF